ncbi:MAG: pitrilysin family protein [Ramlibacter sp.]|jgi:zinc protease|uniref:M16 family metallopeptidase n=1 Tax=Ramlibacter sp. TaxID=1917967 RepID=UPI00260FEDF2|nr:pitrilysin family protein [Ramlibacter sp.]MDH4375212.1 pitrilysin family protein [Ramlibacter sp.]
MKQHSTMGAGLGRTLFLALTLAVTGWAFAQTPSRPQPQVPTAPAPTATAQGPAGLTPSAGVHRFTLDNGLTVIVRPDRRAPTAVHMLWVRVGSMDEVDGTTGVAHVLEHMMFKGTPTVPAGQFSRRVAALGGRENAFTARDYTGYFQQIPANRLEEVMRLEADRFANNRWPDDEFRREIEVVKEERRLRTEDSPRARLFEALNAMTFQASSYRTPVVGWMSDLDAMTPEDVRAFHKLWYQPSNAAVVVAGDVDPAQVLDIARRTYGQIPAGVVPARKPREEPPQRGLRQIEVKVPAEQAVVSLAFKVPRLTSLDELTPVNQDALALGVLASVLNGYPGARLDRGLTQGPDRVADSVSAGNGLWGRGPQLFTLSGVPAAGKTPEQVQAALRAEVARVARDGVSEAELARIKTQWMASEIYKLDAVFNQARELGVYWVSELPLDFGERLIRRLQTVTPAQVQSVAARYFGDDTLTVGILRPVPREAGSGPRTPPAAGHRH